MRKHLFKTFVMMFLVFMVAGIAMPVMSADKPLKWRMATLYPRGTAFGEVYEALVTEPDDIEVVEGELITITFAITAQERAQQLNRPYDDNTDSIYFNFEEDPAGNPNDPFDCWHIRRKNISKWFKHIPKSNFNFRLVEV